MEPLTKEPFTHIRLPGLSVIACTAYQDHITQLPLSPALPGAGTIYLLCSAHVGSLGHVPAWELLINSPEVVL